MANRHKTKAGGEFMHKEQNWTALVVRSLEPGFSAVALIMIDTSSSPSHK